MYHVYIVCVVLEFDLRLFFAVAHHQHRRAWPVTSRFNSGRHANYNVELLLEALQLPRCWDSNRRSWPLRSFRTKAYSSISAMNCSGVDGCKTAAIVVVWSAAARASTRFPADVCVDAFAVAAWNKAKATHGSERHAWQGCQCLFLMGSRRHTESRPECA